MTENSGIVLGEVDTFVAPSIFRIQKDEDLPQVVLCDQ